MQELRRGRASPPGPFRHRSSAYGRLIVTESGTPAAAVAA